MIAKWHIKIILAMEEGEEATNELIKKVQEGKITMKKVMTNKITGNINLGG